MVLAACGSTRDQPTNAPGDGDAASGHPAGWTEATHGKGAPPNYDLVFATDRVHTLTITIDPAWFREMQADLSTLVAEATAGSATTAGPTTPPGGDGGNGPPPEAVAACGGLQADAPCTFTLNGQPLTGTCFDPGDGSLACRPTGPAGGGGAGGGNVIIFSRDPVYVPVTIAYHGLTWWYVGMRYKGNASLRDSFLGGIGKLPFRLEFDKFEDDVPRIRNQRFHGFKKLTFSSNFGDDSQIRECLTDEIFRDRSVPAARCAFYRVLVDVGNGPEYWGLYSAVEDPADGAMLDTQLGGRGGNLYKPEGAGADFTAFNQTAFVKKTNEDQADWSDVENAITALHATAADPATWRAGFERTFDTDRFLGWLAVNTVIYNWDSYGTGAHNYYLYGAPSAGGQLTWIPWDHNMAMMPRPGGAGASTSLTVDAATEIFHTDVGANWPLISVLLKDPVYAPRYRELVTQALGGLFGLEKVDARMREMHDLIAPWVVGADGERAGYTTISSAAAFNDSIDGASGLHAHIVTRHARVEEALAGN